MNRPAPAIPAPSDASQGVAAASPLAMTPTDLAQLMAAFNEVTGKLQATHDQLRAEVARLTRELAEANEQVERSRRLAALGEMAAGIAHEVRNPLGSIRLYARMLAEDLAEQPSQQRLAHKISDATRAVECIVTDVLAFAREFRVQTERVEAQPLFARALEACEADRAGVPGLVVKLRCEGPGAVCEADAGLLQRVLTNLVQNALQAMAGVPGPHTLELSARLVRSPRGSFSVLRVRDSGPGVSPEVVERMFNPFFTTRASGTGLGLAIVHRIVDAHGGRVMVTNNSALPQSERSERGASVDVVLPAPLPTPVPAAMVEVVRTPGGAREEPRASRVSSVSSAHSVKP